MLRDKGTVLGSDLLAIPLPLDEFLQRISHVRELSQRLSALQTAFPTEDNSVDVIKNMMALAGRIATDHAKQVRLTTELQLMAELPLPLRTGLNDIALQLLRNAIVHGIESPTERLVLAKHEVGQVHVSLNRIDDNFEFIMRDDGRGIVPDKIRAELIHQGRYSEIQLQQLNDNQIIMKIFEAGFSTAETQSRDAGRGVGLDVVKHMINQLGASLYITTMENVYTQFRIRFPASMGEAA
jgi:signal transduction histidine kinase